MGITTETTSCFYIMTSKEARDYYFLYEVVDGKFKKLGRAKSPKELEERFEVGKRMEA